MIHRRIFTLDLMLSRSTIIEHGLKILQQSQFDQEWVKSWIEQKQKRSRITLSEYRQRLTHHAHLLQQYQQALEQIDHQYLIQLNNFILNIYKCFFMTRKGDSFPLICERRSGYFLTLY